MELALPLTTCQAALRRDVPVSSTIYVRRDPVTLPGHDFCKSTHIIQHFCITTAFSNPASWMVLESSVSCAEGNAVINW